MLLLFVVMMDDLGKWKSDEGDVFFRYGWLYYFVNWWLRKNFRMFFVNVFCNFILGELYNFVNFVIYLVYI